MRLNSAACNTGGDMAGWPCKTVWGGEHHGRDEASILAGGLAAATLPAFGGLARAQGKQINVFAHRVLQNVSNGTKGGDVTQSFAKTSGATVNWVTFETGPLHDRLFREASLGESTVDVAFILNTYATPRAASLFEALDPYMAKDPIPIWTIFFRAW